MGPNALFSFDHLSSIPDTAGRFVMNRNFSPIYLDLVLSNSFIVTRNFLPSSGLGKKQVNAKLTAPN
jgi:hypothetical protein